MAESTIYTIEQVKSRISEAFPTAVKFVNKEKPRRLFMTAEKGSLLELCKLLRDQLGFEHCSLVCVVDRIDRFQCVYHISSIANKIVAEIVVDLPKENPEID